LTNSLKNEKDEIIIEKLENILKSINYSKNSSLLSISIKNNVVEKINVLEKNNVVQNNNVEKNNNIEKN
jgi:hypothetical protein